MSDRDSTVWAKGDGCMSPYSGDSRLYRGIIQKIKRSPAGQVLAVVKFEGYSEEDCEEVDIKQLQKVTDDNKTVTPKRKKNYSSSSGGLFSPLEGCEDSQRLKSKYENQSDNETEEISVKSEKLTSVLFGEKSSKSGSHGIPSGKQNRKGKVAVGGEPVNRTDNKRNFTHENRSPTLIDSPSLSRRKRPLDITGGEAMDPKKELYTSKRVSDVSSMLDPSSVRKALQSREDHTKSTSKREDHSKSTSKREDHSLSSSEDEEFKPTGFDDTDLEKPRFSFTAEGAKVPFILSQDNVTPVVQVPGVLNQYLRDYQRDGIKFLYTHYCNNTGAILGDDMGLGKTVQVIGFLSALLGKHGNRIDVMRQKPKFIRKMSETASVSCDGPSKGPYLIIGPGCVLYNWLDEFETWGYFSVRKYHGTDKAECMKELKKGKLEIIVTTFETFREHLEVLNAVTWDAVIVDEVHKIKDMKARTTKALRCINTMKRYGLTGTALQNNLLEFWSILDWAVPGCLGTQSDYIHEYVRPIEGGQRHDANKRELATARKQKEKLASIRKSMMIRRVKSLIADQLPKKDDNVVFCRLSQLQLSMYQTILRQPGMDLILNMDDPCHCDSGNPQSKCCKKKTADGQSVRSLMFTFMHLLLKVSNHVALLIPNAKTTAKQEKTARKICEAALKDHPEFVEQTRDAAFRTLSDPKYCGKMKILQGLLKVFYKEHAKTLVFSYSTKVLDIIEQYLMSTGYEYRRIDGQVSSKKRLDIVREYNQDPNIFICLISTKAGGLGLNLTGANKVVIFDPNWNPTHDLQAQDRAYRIGQRRDVHVYRLVSSGTIEENMYLRQIYKQQLLNVTVEDENARRYFYAVQGNPQQKGELFGVKNMFVLRTGEACITRDIIKRNERVESAVEGFETARYIPPVVRIEDDEDIEDLPSEVNASTSESDDYLADFFSSDENPDNVYNDNDRSEMNNHHKTSHRKSTTEVRELDLTSSESDSDKDTNDRKNNHAVCSETKKVRFVEMATGKVRPDQSRTGKGRAKRTVQSDNAVVFDQTLAGTFADVSEVFDNCGVVHIHENVKVVGGSRAEDHMSKCAVSDVYELHQNSQDLAVQCEPMSESSEDEEIQEKREDKKQTTQAYNKVRSEVIGHNKFLIGQTPRSFRQKHLNELCKFHSDGSLLDFAEFVLDSSLEERINLLNSFYSNKYPELSNIHTIPTSKSDSSDGRKKIRRKSQTDTKRCKGTRTSRPVKPRRAAGGTICFLDDLEPDSESISQHSVKTELPESDESSVDSMEIGRKKSKSPCKRNITPRKRKTICRKSHNNQTPSGKRKHVETYTILPGNSECEDDLASDLDDGNGVVEKHDRASTDDDAEDLLNEIGKQPDIVDDIDDGSRIDENDYKSTDALSILDDIFDTSGRAKKRKPAPRKNCHSSSPVKRIKKDKSLMKTEQSDQFKVLDDIFSDNVFEKPAQASTNLRTGRSRNRSDIRTQSVGNDELDEIDLNLDVSTLKDDNELDMLDNPRYWKKKVRKQRDIGSAADKMIADSEADYQELFITGKMKKKTKQPSIHDDSVKQPSLQGVNQPSGQGDSVSVEGLNGSESLF